MIKNKRYSFLVYISTCLTIATCLCSSCTSFYNEEIYHRPAIIVGQPECVFSDESGNVYTFNFGYSGIYTYDSNNHWISYDILKGEKRDIMSVCSDGISLFVFSRRINKPIDYRIDIFGKSLKKQQTFYTNNCIKAMTIAKDYLYCVYSHENERKATIDGLEKINLNSFDAISLIDSFESDCYFEDDDVKLFIQKKGSSSNYYHLVNLSKKEPFYCYPSKLNCYHSIFENIEVEISPYNITVTNSNKAQTISLPYETMRFYTRAYIVEDYLLFGIHEYIKNEECVPGWADNCICHFGESLLLKYDLSRDSFLDSIVYPSQSVLIDYDLNGSLYYYNGELYNHESFVRSSQIIKNNGSITVKDGHYPGDQEERWLILYYDGIIWGV